MNSDHHNDDQNVTRTPTHQLRLRSSLERLVAHPDRVVDCDCALEAGFSSHSHYGAAFRRAFGDTPSAYVRGHSVRLKPDPTS